MVRNSIIILLGSFFLFQLINCKNSETKGDIGYGIFFYQNCSSCHGIKDGFDAAPSLLNLNEYDSLTLHKKLNGIKEDSVHGNCFKSIEYSAKEANSIEEYIKHYFNPRY